MTRMLTTIKMSALSVTALAGLLGSGLPPRASAQQSDDAPPAYGAPPQPRYYTSQPPEYGEGGWLPPGGSLQIQTDQGIRYVSGGIGLSERDELRTLSGQFNLQLMFAMQGSGDYLADIQVRIFDSRGAAILNATSQGPYFLAQLPTGNYTVEVSVLGQTQRQQARVGARQSQLNFYWR
ncbi:MAG: carboxypeptidase-like regulatory domain-containing protein [Candidatus Contendobacter sp.]|nr:carboxypeptidase-like regulatory domain-containing protein [Candidatus Contendobacter sp.]MDG4556970.1 carboxypeptidase-like regulatory domain-containing protein [Candidatus Contendobacter sp.]